MITQLLSQPLSNKICNELKIIIYLTINLMGTMAPVHWHSKRTVNFKKYESSQESFSCIIISSKIFFIMEHLHLHLYTDTDASVIGQHSSFRLSLFVLKLKHYYNSTLSLTATKKKQEKKQEGVHTAWGIKTARHMLWNKCYFVLWYMLSSELYVQKSGKNKFARGFWHIGMRSLLHCVYQRVTFLRYLSSRDYICILVIIHCIP